MQKRFRKVKYITLVNLLSTGELYPADLSPYDPSQPGAEKVLFPEYLTCEDKSAAMAGHVIQWLKDSAALARQIAALEQLKAEVAHGGALGRAAEYILRELNGEVAGTRRVRATLLLNFPLSPFSLIIRDIRRRSKDFACRSRHATAAYGLGKGEKPRTDCGSELAMTPTGFGTADRCD